MFEDIRKISFAGQFIEKSDELCPFVCIHRVTKPFKNWLLKRIHEKLHDLSKLW